MIMPFEKEYPKWNRLWQLLTGMKVLDMETLETAPWPNIARHIIFFPIFVPMLVFDVAKHWRGDKNELGRIGSL